MNEKTISEIFVVALLQTWTESYKTFRRFFGQPTQIISQICEPIKEPKTFIRFGHGHMVIKLFILKIVLKHQESNLGQVLSL